MISNAFNAKHDHRSVLTSNQIKGSSSAEKGEEKGKIVKILPRNILKTIITKN